MSDPPVVVIDTNVWAVAEGMHDGASDQCVGSCLALLQRISDGVVLAVDADDQILAEYLGTLSAATTSGLAVKLANRLWRTRHNADHCKPVAITPTDSGSFVEVPSTLRNFDQDDQKFLAVAVAEGSTAPVFQALDAEWWERRVDLAAGGLDVQFLCAADLVTR